MFIHRSSELVLLERLYSSNPAEIFLLSGQHGVGKTSLLARFCEGKKVIFHVCDLETELSARTALSAEVNAFLIEDDRIHAVYPTWDEIFQAFGKAASSERLIVVLDEFQNLVAAHPAILTALQSAWEQFLKNWNLLLILSSSDAGLLENLAQVFQTQSPGSLITLSHLAPFSFKESLPFFKDYLDYDQVRTYAVFGGMPAYLNPIDPNSLLSDNIFNLILQRTSYLYAEPRLTLQQTLREPRLYFAILQAIAFGITRLREIRQVTGIENAHVYLDNLRQLQIVVRTAPVTESQPQQSRMGRYHIKDHFLRFWFRFVFPNYSLLELGEGKLVLEKYILPELDTFVAPMFADICQEYFQELGFSGRLPYHPHVIGKWWNNQAEIDLLLLGDETIEFVVCDWSVHPVGTTHLAELERKAELLRPNFPGHQIHYGMCSRSGFTRQLVDSAHQRGDIGLHPLKRIIND